MSEPAGEGGGHGGAAAPSVSVLVNTFRSRDALPALVSALEGQGHRRLELVLVDNDPEAPPLEPVPFRGEPATLVTVPRNLGYGPSLNHGIGRARGRYLFVLNPDAVPAEPEVVERLVQAMEEAPRYGLVSPQVVEDGSPIYEASSGITDRPSVKGCAMFIRRAALVETGPFDPAFFLFAEEDDLCLRMRRNGWGVGVVGTARVEHGRGHSFGRIGRAEQEAALISYVRSANLIRAKSYPPTRLARWILSQYLISVPGQLLAWLLGRDGLARRLEDPGPAGARARRGNLPGFAALAAQRLGPVGRTPVAGLWLRGKLSALRRLPGVLRRRRQVPSAAAGPASGRRDRKRPAGATGG